jgi:hypothetical protein
VAIPNQASPLTGQGSDHDPGDKNAAAGKVFRERLIDAIKSIKFFSMKVLIGIITNIATNFDLIGNIR